MKDKKTMMKTWESHGCSTPGCGYPDGKPCIRCGLIIEKADKSVHVPHETELPWQVWYVNDYETWLGRTKLEVMESVLRYYDCELPKEVTEETLASIGEEERLFEAEFIEPLSDGELGTRHMWSHENTDPYAMEHWQCECGAMADVTCRFNGEAWEHHHPYPVGHVLMKNIHYLTFKETLERRIGEGPEVSMFSSTEA